MAKQGEDNAVDELTLLSDDYTLEDIIEEHEIKTAPLFTREALLNSGASSERSQYGVLGRVLAVHQPPGSHKMEDPRLYVNTNAPFSALVCGVQGSGKSHTVSVMLENMLYEALPSIGSCKKALSGLVLHFSEGGSGAQPCEAAWKVYTPLQDVESILRELGEGFTYKKFLSEINKAKKDMNPAQRAMLNQRLALLHSFVLPDNNSQKSLFEEGQLAVVDLSDPFIDPTSACSLFEIVTRLFVRSELNTGKVLVVDEAHKYLSANRGDSGLTRALTSLIRQQRHLAMRVVISTQEPTAVPPVLIDLVSIAIFHRFSSPAWWEAVAKRVCADVSTAEAFERVVKLKTGQALVLCPSGLGLFATTRKTASGAVVHGKAQVAHFGRRYLLIKTRRRITVDGGASIMALKD
ncbi:hypothetical protein GSI_00584 [Ganoderma sinense ZZ0214-1]|uniref:Zona occludens toxin N-terminal domain-containing protein n=1 Tax=Ganoderma sinense ZZ0214-1 TaxID=1077348 RepID=A0A2G8ST13_9APHY|nr:hypothetical protein GSI_00584 [Ganoderma sinense ZZ0214-1]